MMDEIIRSYPTGGGMMGDMAVAESVSALSQPIGKEQIAKAYQTLLKYKSHKTNLERRIVDDQQWYKLRQWEVLRSAGAKQANQVEPTSAWLLNAIANKHADAMDNIPVCSVRPQEASDEGEAKMLSSVIPYVLDATDFEEVYDEHQYNKLISGTGVYGVFWDGQKLNGLGDVSVEEIDIINLFWESGITDIQQSRNVFYVSLIDNDTLVDRYPELNGKLSSPVMDISKYIYDDTIDITDKSIVVDWYYKKLNGGQTVLHYCQFIAGQPQPLFATENEAEYAERGLYDHGKYPFIFDALYSCKGTPCGFGYVDIGKSTQEYIDRCDQAILQNMLFNCKPRHFIRNDGSVNEAEYADTTKDFVHVDGNLGDDSIMPVRANPLNDIYVSVQLNKINELKEVTGNRDVSTGGTTGGATAASAIAAMQEAGSKLSRDSNKGSYRAYRQMCLMIIELIRQFYSLQRTFRITGANGEEEFAYYSNAGLVPQAQGAMLDGTQSYRLPQFDVKVTAEKQSPYTKVAANELALQLYSAGFFHPQNAEPALACLSMMDFDGKDKMAQEIQHNSLLMQQFQALMQSALMMAQTLDKEHGTNIAEGLAAQMGIAAPTSPKGVSGDPKGLSADSKESTTTAKARAQTAQSTAPQ